MNDMDDKKVKPMTPAKWKGMKKKQQVPNGSAPAGQMPKKPWPGGSPC